MQSRLSRTAEKKTKKQLYLSIAGIVIVLFILIKFGIPALVNFSILLSNLRGTNTSTTQQTGSSAIVVPPILTTSFTATNSANIDLTGSAAPKERIQLYMNDDMVDTTSTSDDGTFSFKGIRLTQQQNTIKAKAVFNNKQSDFSDPLSITYIQKAPTLSLDTPSDGQSFPHDRSSVTVKGKTDPDVRVTVNGFWATIDSQGNYSYTLQLQNGDNHITVDAVDAAGNKTEKQIKVTYSQ